jgi:hypothetical protein
LMASAMFFTSVRVTATAKLDTEHRLKAIPFERIHHSSTIMSLGQKNTPSKFSPTSRPK